MQWITRTRWAGSLSLLLGLVLFTPGCAMLEVGGHSGHAGHHAKAKRGHGGPPAHAPAHGYRRKHAEHGTTLVFDSNLGLYIVVGLEDVFFHGDLYFQLSDGGWSVSAHPDTGWKRASRNKLPPGLRDYRRGKHYGKRRGHGHGPPASHR